ncbi:MAG: MATE family efflux transporter, partial [Spirochaetota bacterium]
MTFTKQTTLARLLRIAFPMVISQASDSIMLFVSRLFLSRLGEEYLSASMSGGLTQFMLSSFFIGTVGYVNALVAQLYGAERKEECAEATFQAVLLAAACYPLLLVISPLARYLFLLSGQQPVQIALGYEYFQTLVFGSIFLVLRFAVSGFFLGIGRTTAVMLANLTAMLISIPANYVFIFGKLGFPAMGLRGAALGTISGNMIAFIILFTLFLRPGNRREFNTHKCFRLNRRFIEILLRFGLPTGFEMFLNMSAFNIFLQFMHSYGIHVAAAVTITFNWDIVAFIPMIGMSNAATALVGQNIGAGDYEEAKHSTYVALRVAWIYSGSMMLLFLFATRHLVGTFASGFDGNTRDIIVLASVMLRLASIYTLADSAQLIFTGALRGAGDTRWVMLMSVGLHWAFAVVSIFIIRVVKADPVTVWIFFIGLIVCLGIAMFLRFRSGI